MKWHSYTCTLSGMFSIIIWALLASAANADQKDQTQGQKDAHLLACAQAYYACLGQCSQAVSDPLMTACKKACDGRVNSCKAEAPASGGPLKKQLPK